MDVLVQIVILCHILIKKMGREMATNYCSNCGAKIDQTINYCSNCGEQIESPQSNQYLLEKAKEKVLNTSSNKKNSSLNSAKSTPSIDLTEKYIAERKSMNKVFKYILLFLALFILITIVYANFFKHDNFKVHTSKIDDFYTQPTENQNQNNIGDKNNKLVSNKTQNSYKVNFEEYKPSYQTEFESVVKKYAVEKSDYDLVSLNIQIRDKAYEWAENNDFQINDWLGKVTHKNIYEGYSVWLQIESRESNPRICYEGYVIRKESESAFSNALKINIDDIVNIDGKFDTEYKRSALSGIIKGKKLTESPLNVLQKQYYKLKDFKVVKYSK